MKRSADRTYPHFRSAAKMWMSGALLLILARPALAAKPKTSQTKPEAASETVTSLPLLPPPTEPVTVEMVLSRFERLDRSLTSLSADFRQQVAWQEAGTEQTVEGTVDFRKPDLLRLEHRKPEPQTLVSDGTWLWIYRPSTEQVIKTRFADWKKSEPMAQGLLDFGDYSNLIKSYDASISTVSAPGADGQRQVALALKPKEKSKAGEFVLTLHMSTRDYFPAATDLKAGSVMVHSVFSNIRYNPALPDSRFRFTPPPGADVFDNVKPPKGQ